MAELNEQEHRPGATRIDAFQKHARWIYRHLGLSALRRYLLRMIANRLSKKSGDRFEVQLNGKSVLFATDDAHSKRWFYPRLSSGRIHEEPATLMLLEVLKDSQCLVDVGANLGWYTCLGSTHMPHGTVYSFEMDEANFSLLQKNLTINKCRNVRAYCLAVNDTPGYAAYRKHLGGPDSGFQLTPRLQETECSDTIRAKAITLDGIFEHEELVPDVIKVDVEGAEMRVLEGMKKIMQSRSPRLFLEIHPNKLPTLGSSVQEIVSLLIDNGYGVFEIVEMRRHGGSRRLSRLDRNSRLTKNARLYCERS